MTSERDLFCGDYPCVVMNVYTKFGGPGHVMQALKWLVLKTQIRKIL